MKARSALLGLIIWTAVVAADATQASAADSSAYQVSGFRLGATVEKIQAAATKSDLITQSVVRGPSFEQAIMQAQRKLIPGRDYAGVRMVRARGEAAEAQVTFAPTPEGPRAIKIVYDVLPGGPDIPTLEAKLLNDYGAPNQRSEREWVWGDTGAFYSRKNAYLEFRPNPVSAGVRRPIATLILADPALQERSRETIAVEAAKGS
ncbi:hypothetical protein [Amorphus sp. 3PC139-8]|uniref:hypothetical protein n=1 Tax=Amorphus sp. 3PC139-8 TaxID=2735676 RepID=UPI00345DA47D